ncbi:MAG TPA: L-histidine N(alpha)-methyltransferase [Terracidiphilus sp.]|jgi:L-histidine N-alpha-methyltransferase|nr:L-histidine N(alpha)-methyltransferase [Terracidiphilus sp.]
MAISAVVPYAGPRILERVATAAREGLAQQPKRLPPWLFYDEAGSQLFDAITRLPEYYLTRTERSILEADAGAIIARAAAGDRLRIAELGAGSADKTRLLLTAACRRQGPVIYEPIDVSGSALEAAQERIEREIPRVRVEPQVMDYTESFALDPAAANERRLVLYIGSSIGNFEPQEAALLLKRVRRALQPGDALLLGVDLVKENSVLLPAYNDAAGVTAAFNRNMLLRLNRELGADFDSNAFVHRAVWNETGSRVEMHLESCKAQSVRFDGMEMRVEFGAGERIHTENSYKYRPGQAEMMLAQAGFMPEATWTDARGWFAVCLGRAGARN